MISFLLNLVIEMIDGLGSLINGFGVKAKQYTLQWKGEESLCYCI